MASEWLETFPFLKSRASYSQTLLIDSVNAPQYWKAQSASPSSSTLEKTIWSKQITSVVSRQFHTFNGEPGCAFGLCGNTLSAILLINSLELAGKSCDANFRDRSSFLRRISILCLAVPSLARISSDRYHISFESYSSETFLCSVHQSSAFPSKAVRSSVWPSIVTSAKIRKTTFFRSISMSTYSVSSAEMAKLPNVCADLHTKFSDRWRRKANIFPKSAWSNCPRTTSIPCLPTARSLQDVPVQGQSPRSRRQSQSGPSVCLAFIHPLRADRCNCQHRGSLVLQKFFDDVAEVVGWHQLYVTSGWYQQHPERVQWRTYRSVLRKAGMSR